MQEISKNDLLKKQQINRNTYSTEFKIKIVKEVLDGKLTKTEAQRVYGLGGKSAILNWIRKFNLVSNYNLSENIFLLESSMPKKDEDLEKDQKIRVLEKALESERNKSALFEKIIEIAEEKYGLEIRKKSEAKQSRSLNQKKGKK